MIEKLAIGLYLGLVVAYIVTVVVVLWRCHREDKAADLEWRERRWR